MQTNRWINTCLQGSLLSAGIGLLGLAVFAYQLGIDHNPEWGRGRYILALAGALLLAAGLALTFWLQILASLRRSRRAWLSFWEYHLIQSSLSAIKRFFHSWTERFKASRVYEFWLRTVDHPIRRSRLVQFFLFSPARRLVTSAALVFLVTEIIYIFFVSVGFWTRWPETTSYFSLLGQSIRAGHLYLPIEPDPRLASLPDPYNYHARQGISIPWDASFYQGKYYLYWGPTPALVTAAAQSIFPIEVGDQDLVFAFVTGSFLMSLLLIILLWRRLFSKLPWWTAIPALLAAGLANPMPWLLNRPAVYEASIAAGQCFWMAGLYWAVSTILSEKLSLWKPFLAGICWALAAGSRVTLAPAIIFLTLLLLMGFHRAWSKAGRRLWLPLLAPLALGAAGLAGYNAARFGSIFEFGHRFQLTGIDLTALYPWIYSPRYLIPGIYGYLFRPVSFLTVFPYVKAPWIDQYNWPFFINPPQTYYYPEPVSGLLLTTPFAWLAVLPALFLLVDWIRSRSGLRVEKTQPWQERWISLALTGVVLIELALLVSFYTSTMRYLADLIPSLVILAGIGFWQAYARLIQRLWLRKLMVFVTCLLVLITILTSTLLAVTGYQARFEIMNPVLFDRLTRIFTP